MWEVCLRVSTLGLSTSGRVKKQDAVRELSFLQRPGQVPGGALELALTTQTCPAPGKGACSLYSFTEQSLAAAFPPAPREECDRGRVHSRSRHSQRGTRPRSPREPRRPADAG